MRFGVELPSDWTLWAGLLAAGAFALHARRSEAPRALLVLRAAATLSLVLALLRPTLAARRPVLVKPRLAVVVDASHSMRGPAGAVTRLEAAKRWLLDRRGTLEERADVRLFAAAGGARRLLTWEELEKLSPSNSALHPTDALRDVLDDPSSTPKPDRAWLLSDGNAEPVPDLDAALAAARLPIDALAVGPERRGRSLALVEATPPDFAFLHGRVSVSAVVEASELSGVPVRIRLLRDGAVVDEQILVPQSGYETLSASVTAVAQSLGQQKWRLEASAGGKVAARDVRVEVVRQKYRIMYLAGRPSPEYSFLRDFLKSDPNHELVSFVILRNPENPTLVPDSELSLIPFPAEEIFVRDIAQFDLFILENFSYSRFRLPPSYLQSLKSFVAGGGALLVVGGENAFAMGGYRGTPVEELLPVALSSEPQDFTAGHFQAKPSASAAGHPLIKLYEDPKASEEAWQALPALDGWAKFAAVKPGSTVLAVHPSERAGDGQPLPVVALRAHGKGKVMLISTDSTWRWKLGSAADWRVGTFYARFWTRVVQYLTGSLDLSKVKFAPLPDRMPAREPAVLSLRVFDESFRPADPAGTDVTVLWTPPGGAAREVPARPLEPGVYQIELTGLALGQHRVRASAKWRGRAWGEDAVRFDWQPPSSDAPVDKRWLKRVADATGGELRDVSSADAAALLAALPPVREEAEVSRRYSPASTNWWLLLTGLLFAAEWALRRRRGLP